MEKIDEAAEYAQDVQRVREGFAVLAQRLGDIAEILGDIRPIEPEMVGQILMEVLPLDSARLSAEQKLFWMEVGEWMGPDWIAQLRRIAAFMDKVDQF